MSGTNESNAAAQPQSAGQSAPAGSGAHPADSYGRADADESPVVAVPGTQNEPVQDMHDASEEDKIAGIVAQTRQDVGDKDEARIADVLRQRFSDTGIHVADDRVAALAAEAAIG